MSESANEFITRNKIALEKNIRVKMKDIGRKGVGRFTIESRTYLVPSNNDRKILVLDRLRFMDMEGKSTRKVLKEGEVEYRIGYYIVGQIGRMEGKWTWGQFCPMIPHDDLYKLIENAEKEGTLLSKKK